MKIPYKTVNRKYYSILKLIYDPNKNNVDKETEREGEILKNVRIFGKAFINKNKGKYKIIYKNKEYVIKEYFEEIINNNYNDNNLIKIKIKIINNISNMSHMFEGCNTLISLSEIIKGKTLTITIKLNNNKYDKNVFCSTGPQLLPYNFIDNNKSYKDYISLESSFPNHDHLVPSINQINKIIQINSSKLPYSKIKVTDSNKMFYGCISLVSLPVLSNWNIPNIIISDTNIIKGIIQINTDDINTNITLFSTDINNKIDVYVNKIKVNIIKDNKEWKYKFTKEGEYNFEIVFRNIINNMFEFFNKCSNLISLDFSIFDTLNIADMSYMFSFCKNLKEIKGINNFKTKNVINMYAMFNECRKLEHLDLSSFNTSNVLDMGMMFSFCQNIKEIKGINNFNTNKVTNMNGMFQSCSELKYLNLSNFNTSNVINMSYMFNGCNRLEVIEGIKHFNTIKVTNMKVMFQLCIELKNLDLSCLDTSNVMDMSYMFYSCSKLKEIKGIKHFNTCKVINMYAMFNGCDKLEYLDLSSFNTSNVTDMGMMFCFCKNLREIKGLNVFNTNKVTNMKNYVPIMF